MKVRVTIGDRAYEVEVGDLQARPILATIEGEQFDVWPEDLGAATKSVVHASAAASAPAKPAARMAGSGAAEANTVRAPIPGVIASIAVQAGTAVTAGQELCVLEAMKMKNVIRAPRPGTIASVHVSVGQHVKHRDVLMEFGG
jgi:biotin carboxyl carrier protein